AASFLPVILIPFLITALSKFAQGSGSVAALLGASLSIPLIQAGLMSPIAAFISISAGSHCGSHVNNSFFWVF
ncbi:GntP family permease, partial [Eggerthella lenta]|uniref:GntP family permease n=1 Tax=Eggerthella lenta TaxID=84112 RepID=UPI001D06845F|nr:GntP family permease [Eggerthella lenta]